MTATALRTPPSVDADSDGVLLALETARALEEQGEQREAARWIRRAADEAEQDGDDDRALVLARAAADLRSAIESSPETAPPPARPALPTIPSPGSDTTIPPPPALPQTPPTVSYVCELSTAAGEPLAQRTTRVGAIRVAITGSVDGDKAFVVQRLEPGQVLPSGTTAAILVLTGELEGPVELTSHLRVVERSTNRS
jgi:hypothetical protein